MSDEADATNEAVVSNVAIGTDAVDEVNAANEANEADEADEADEANQAIATNKAH